MKIIWSNKGLTPIIAIILLLLMTVAAASASFFWIVRIQGELQGGTSQFQDQTFNRIASSVQWQSGNYNETTETLTLTLLNAGTINIPMETSATPPNIQWTLLDNEQDIFCQTDWSGTGSAISCSTGCTSQIGPSEVRLIKLSLSGSDCDLTAQTNGSIWSAKISFSGKATTSGSFDK